jgi:hypothetical protein
VLNWAPRHEGVLGSGSIAPLILDLGTRWRWVASFTPRPLYPQGKSPSYPLARRLGGPQSRSGRSDEEKSSQPLPGLEPPIIQSVSQLYTTELSRLYCCLCMIQLCCYFMFPLIKIKRVTMWGKIATKAVWKVRGLAVMRFCLQREAMTVMPRCGGGNVVVAWSSSL